MEKAGFFRRLSKYEPVVNAPDNLMQMIQAVETPSKDFPFARVDFFRMNDGRLDAGEFAFYPCAGYCERAPPEWDLKLGQMIQLPEKRI